jgi:hypothetical protein
MVDRIARLAGRIAGNRGSFGIVVAWWTVVRANAQPAA